MGFFAGKIGIKGCDRAVLDEIVNRCAKEDREALPTSTGHLERETGYSHRPIRNSIDKLIGLGLIAIATDKAGTRGCTYSVNFDWARDMDFKTRLEIRRRQDAKQSRRGVQNNPSSDETLEGCKTTPLRTLVGFPSTPLGTVEGFPSTPQTYDGTYQVPIMGDTPRVAQSGADGPASARGGGPRVWEIAGASLSTEGGNTWLALDLRCGDDSDTADICIEHENMDTQQAGQRTLGLLSDALGRDITADTDVVGLRVLVDGAGNISPAPVPVPVPANDNDNHDEEASHGSVAL